MTRCFRRAMNAIAAFSLLTFGACNNASSTTGAGDGSTTLPSRDGKTRGNALGQKALDIEAPLLGESKPFRLVDHRGKVVLLDFWATWCPPCVAAIPHEKELVKRFQNRPFVLVGISIDRKMEHLTKYLGKNPLPWSNVFDEGERISADWNIEAVPTFVVIDDQGRIVGRWEGAEDLQAIETLIEQKVQEIEKRK